MTVQMKLLHNHPGSPSYRVSKRDADRLGLPVLKQSQVVRRLTAKERQELRQKAAIERDKKVRAMALEVRKARETGAKTDCHLVTLKVALRTGFLFSELKQPGRKRRIVAARKRAIYGIRTATWFPLTKIGRFFGKDHTTILHHIHERAEEFGLPLPEGIGPRAAKGGKS